MQLSKKQMSFQNVLLHFWNLRSLFKVLKKKKDEPYRLCISEIKDYEGLG